MEIKVDTGTVRIETNRLVLRGFREDDLADFYDYAKVDGVGECAGCSHHKSIEESRRILSMFIEGRNVFAIALSGREHKRNRFCSRKGFLGQRTYDGSRESRHLLLL